TRLEILRKLTHRRVRCRCRARIVPPDVFWDRRIFVTAAPRDVEQFYSTPEVVAKLRRLADALETHKPFRIQIAGDASAFPRGLGSRSSTNATTARRRSSSS